MRISPTVKWVVIPLVLVAMAIGGYLYWSYASIAGIDR